MSDLHDTLSLGELDESRWRRIRAVLDAALELPDDRRRAYLDRACRGEPELRSYVEKLIDADASAGDFLNSGPRTVLFDPLPDPPFTWGRLEAMEKLGSGSYGSVFRAHDITLDRDVALKLWHHPAARAEEFDRLVWEARRLARVRHPNILVVHGVDEHDGRMGLWTELIEGTTVEDGIASSGPLSAAEAASIGITVCNALAALHSAGLVHRDIKTTNVMRDRSGRVVLVDFGTVRELTGTGAIAANEPPAGTPSSMAPEQLAGENVGPEADVYGVGVLLYRLVTGRLPIEVDTMTELTRHHAEGQAVPLSERRADLSAPFVAVVERALAPDPATRFPGIGALQQALSELPEAAAAAPTPLTADEPFASRMLPRALTPFIGREIPLSECEGHLAAFRLLTLTGPAGSGKTRLGLELAEREAPRFADGALFVDLGLVRSGESTLDGIAIAVGVRPGAGRDTQQMLESRLGPMHVLLVLDNCEHVRDEVARHVKQLLASCPELSVLATSQTPLELPDECVYVVPPLELPSDDSPVEEIARAESVKLFVERASLVRFGFELNRAVATDVAEICRRLEGIPLAIELAASNARLLTPHQMLERLKERVLSLSARAMPARHRTLEAAIRWSFGLLDPEDRLLLPALAVFEGGWTGSAAAAVCLPHTDPFQGLERLGRLVDASLVIGESNRQGGTRYRMLETVRAFALEQLSESGRYEEMRRRHIAYFRAMAVESDRAFWGPRQAEWLSRLDEDHANLMAATRAAAVVPGELENGLGLAGALYRYWYSRGLVRLGRSLLAELLALPNARPDGEARLKALYASAGLAVFEGEVAYANARFEEGLALSSAHGEVKSARWHIGLSIVAQHVGKFDEARAHLLRSLGVYREAGDDSAQIVVLHNLAEVELCEGHLDAARDREHETLQKARHTGNVLFEAIARVLLGSIAARQGDAGTAREHLRASPSGVRSIRAKVLGVELIEAACQLALAEGDVDLAARWLGLTDAERETSGLIPGPYQAIARAEMRDRITSRLGSGDGTSRGAGTLASSPLASGGGDAPRPGANGSRRIDYAGTLDEVERWLDRA